MGIPTIERLLCIKSYDFFKVCDITSSADLPHAGDAWLYCKSSTMMNLILRNLSWKRWSCSYKTHITFKYIKELFFAGSSRRTFHKVRPSRNRTCGFPASGSLRNALFNCYHSYTLTYTLGLISG